MQHCTPNTNRYIYRYRCVITNSAGDQQIMKSDVFDNPYKMSIALLQSYRFLEQRLLGDLALVRRPTSDFILDLIKLRIAITKARSLITQICCEPDFPGQITEGFTVLEFTPRSGAVPVRAAIMEVYCKSAPENTSDYELQPLRTHFTPVEYKFINQYMRFLRSVPQFPSF